MAEVAQMELLPASLVAQQTPVRQSENRLCYAIFADTHITEQELEPIVQAVPNADRRRADPACLLFCASHHW